MKCDHPTVAYIIGKAAAKDGIISPRLTFSPNEALSYYHGLSEELAKHEVYLPCGKCPACQVKKRKDMATRLVHEFSMHDVGCFLTLTYDDEHLPLSHRVDDEVDFLDQVTFGVFAPSVEILDNPTLYPPHLQAFLKRLRRNIEYHEHRKGVRFYAVGEYGGRTHRPHYHLMIFGWSPSECDREVFFKRNGHYVYKSALISRLWSHGYVSFCDLSAAVAKYAARYTTKKLIEDRRERDAPWRIGVNREFSRQSVRGGGIGSPWLARYKRNLLNGLLTYQVGDRVCKVAIPDYYVRRLRKIDPALFQQVREIRTNYAIQHRNDEPLPFDRQYADWRRSVDWYDNLIDKELRSDSM